MSAGAWHPDLVAFVAGLRPPQGGADDEMDVGAHLDACDDCRSEVQRLRSLRHTLRRAIAGAHPADQLLADYDEPAGRQDSATRAAIEAHLQRCADCRDDLAALARARQVRGQGAWTRPPATVVVSRLSRRSFAAAAAAIVALVAAAAAISAWRGFARPVPPPSAPPAVTLTFMPPRRSGTEDRRLVAGARAAIHVVLPLQAADGSYRARVERVDGTISGRTTGAIPSHDETVVVEIEAPAAPGSYRLVLDRADAAPPETYVYPFQVEASPRSPERQD